MDRKRRRELVVVLLQTAAMVGGLVYSCRNPPPERASKIPLAIADGRAGTCAVAAVEREDLPCPYGRAPAKVDGVDYGAAFEISAGRCIGAGKLRLTTGRLAAVDPLAMLDTAVPIDPAVRPGDYPVVLRMQGADVALALVQIANTRPTRWAPVRAAGESASYRYDVDSGTGCYTDAATAALLTKRENAELDRRIALVKQRGVEPADGDGWSRALDAIPTSPDLVQVMRGEGLDVSSRVNVCVDGATGANLVAFESGAGDGSYQVYAGYDARGNVAAFVTDFQLIVPIAPTAPGPPGRRDPGR